MFDKILNTWSLVVWAFLLTFLTGTIIYIIRMTYYTVRYGAPSARYYMQSAKDAVCVEGVTLKRNMQVSIFIKENGIYISGTIIGISREDFLFIKDSEKEIVHEYSAKWLDVDNIVIVNS